MSEPVASRIGERPNLSIREYLHGDSGLTTVRP